jgi:hypothetical protein
MMLPDYYHAVTRSYVVPSLSCAVRSKRKEYRRRSRLETKGFNHGVERDVPTRIFLVCRCCWHVGIR